MASSRLKDYTNSLSILPFALYILVSFATQLIEIPFLRLFEKAICNRHYRSIGHQSPFVVNDVDETSCKIPVAQDQLSDVVGWKIFFDAIPGIHESAPGRFLKAKTGNRITDCDPVWTCCREVWKTNDAVTSDKRYFVDAVVHRYRLFVYSKFAIFPQADYRKAHSTPSSLYR